MAYESITMNSSGTVFGGRLLAMHGAVALDANTITVPTTASVTLVSAAVVTGPYTDAVGQSVNLATKTITVPLSGDMRFYRIRSNTAPTITSITISGGNVVMTYN